MATNVNIGNTPSFLCIGRHQNMPSSANLALSEVAEAAGAATEGTSGGAGETGDQALRSALGRLVRSKGFMWLAFSDKAAMYWSHAGEQLLPEGKNMFGFRGEESVAGLSLSAPPMCSLGESVLSGLQLVLTGLALWRLGLPWRFRRTLRSSSSPDSLPPRRSYVLVGS